MENEIIPNLWEKKERDNYAQTLSNCFSLLDPVRITAARQDYPEIFITTKGNTFDRPLVDIEFVRLSNKISWKKYLQIDLQDTSIFEWELWKKLEENSYTLFQKLPPNYIKQVESTEQIIKELEILFSITEGNPDTKNESKF